MITHEVKPERNSESMKMSVAVIVCDLIDLVIILTILFFCDIFAFPSLLLAALVLFALGVALTIFWLNWLKTHFIIKVVTITSNKGKVHYDER